MSDNDFSNDSMLELYLFEATGLLDQLDNILLESESNNSLTAENINEIFRIMHTIKGSSAMMAFDFLSNISHKVEDLFAVIRDNGVPEESFQNLFDLILKVSDFLKDEIKKIQEGEDLATDNPILEEDVQAMLLDFSSDAPAKPKMDIGRTLGGDIAENHEPLRVPAPKPMNIPDYIPSKAANDAPVTDETTYYLHVYFNEGSKMENIRAFMLVNKLKETGTVNESIPDDLQQNADAAAKYIIENGFYCSYTTTLTREEIETISKSTLSVESVSFMKKMPTASGGEASTHEVPHEKGEQEIEVAQTPPDQESVTKQEPNNPSKETKDAFQNEKDSEKAAVVAATGTSRKTKQNLINVDLTKLDNLMDLVGELVITESMVTENPDLKDLKLDNFKKSARQLNKLTDELQDIVMSVRLVPISSVFHRMRRIVRDMNRDLGKDVELILIGENTEVDKTILDALGDPIMHLVRNAMDHAIESKEERIKANKSPTGHIILSAQNMGGDIIISVSDDGRGLTPDIILAKAKEKNLLTKPESEYTDKEIFNLLMTPGFSTKNQVTEYSGRGVGMDVVKMNIKAIGGSVTIESVQNLGTNIFMKIPITLAIIPCMEIRVSNDIFSLPISNIKESFKIGTGELITDTEGHEMILMRGNVYPVIRLHEKYNIEGSVENIEDAILILVDSGDKMACLMADELISKSQVVVKPIPTYLGEFNVKKSGISGCTIMGDGNISLILDVMEILA